MRRFALVLLAGCAAPLRGEWKSGPAPVLDERFFPDKSPWRGGDAIYSVPLSTTRILWLFGDSFIARPGTRSREGSKMVRNSLAIQLAGGNPEFFWRTQDGQPADALSCPVPGEWYWPLSGLRIGPKLHLFLYRVRTKGEGAFGFETVATLLATIDNPDHPPEAWKMTAREVPPTFGTASLVVDGTAYLYGLRGTHALVASAPAGRVEDISTWRYWSGQDWGAEREKASPLFPGAATEMSVSWLAATRTFVAVRSAPMLSPDIQVLQAPRPEGPWGAPKTVFRCPEADWKKGYFCYAAKAHPEMDSTGSRLAISYACNSMNFADAVHDLRIYRPRFVVVTVE